MHDHDPHQRFMRLFLQHEPEIMRSILVFVPSRADARDIVQETALALWQHFGEYDPSRPFIAWACGFARIEVRRFLRRTHRRAALSEAAAVALMTGRERSAREEQEIALHLAECQARLPENHRRLLHGYYVDEESVTTLAQRHERSVEAVYKTLQRIRHALLDCIERKAAEAGQ